MVKNLSASAGDARDIGSIPGSGRSPGGRYGKPLQYSCLENLTDRGAWWATVHRATKSQIRLSDCMRAHTHTHTHTVKNRVQPDIETQDMFQWEKTQKDFALLWT